MPQQLLSADPNAIDPVPPAGRGAPRLLSADPNALDRGGRTAASGTALLDLPRDSGRPGEDGFAPAGEPAPPAGPPPVRTLSVGGKPYATGPFTDEELATIGRSPAAQGSVPPEMRPGAIPAPGEQPPTVPRIMLTPNPGPGSVTAPMGSVPGLDLPITSARAVASHAAALARGALTPAPATTPDQRVPRGRFTGLTGKVTPVPDETLDHVTGLIHGLFGMATPLAVGGAIADLPGTALTLASSYVAGITGEKVAALAGGSPSEQRFAGAITGAATALGMSVDQIGRLAKAKISEVAEATADAAKSAARPLVLAGQLQGYGPGTVPGYTGEPYVAEASTSAGELPSPEWTGLSEQEIREGQLAVDQAAARKASILQAQEDAQAPAPTAQASQGEVSPADVAGPQLVSTEPTAAEPVDLAGRPLGGYAGPERRVADQTVAPEDERRLLPADQVRKDLIEHPELLVQQAAEMKRKADAARETPTATFLGWQPPVEDVPPTPLYNVTGGEFDGSTVGPERLQSLGIEVPETPPYEAEGAAPMKQAAQLGAIDVTPPAGPEPGVLMSANPEDATLTEGSHGETPATETPAGVLARGGDGELHGAPVGGVQPPRQRATRRAAREAARADVARAEQEDLDHLVATAQSRGYTGEPDALRAELVDRLQGIKELNAELGESGQNGLVLLRAIARGGGISMKKETGQKGEIGWLKSFQDTRPPKAGRGNLARRPVVSGQIRGVRGVYHDAKGLTLDGMVEYLAQDPNFSHITSINELVEAVRRASTGADESIDAMKSLKGWLNTQRFEDVGTATHTPDEYEGDTSFNPAELETGPGADVMDTGEVQPRLPEAGAVRDREVATPTFSAPFALQPETQTETAPSEQDLLGGTKSEITGQPRLSIRAGTYRDEEGFHVVGTDADGRKVKVFAGSRGAAEHIKSRLAQKGVLLTPDDFTLRGAKGDPVGPRVVGGTYRDGYWGQRYTVEKIQREPFAITVRWEEGPNAGKTASHATPWEAKRDRVIEQPTPSGTEPVKVSSMGSGGRSGAMLRPIDYSGVEEPPSLPSAPPMAPESAQPAGGTTLQSTIIPGAAEFVEQDVLPALKEAANVFAQAGAQLRRSFAPTNIGTARQAAGALAASLAAEAQANAQMEHASRAFQRTFDRLLREPGGQDKAIDWWDAVQTGQPEKILPELKAAADYMRAANTAEVKELQKIGKLQEADENYFAQIWQFPKEDTLWIQRKIAGLMGRRPFEGRKGFLKQRKYPTFREGLDALLPRGIKPISYNPVDHFLIKMREMRRFRYAHAFIDDAKTMGIWKPFGGTFGKMPDGWSRIEGSLGTIYGPPVVQMQEGYDPDLMKGLESLAKDLDVNLSRTVKKPAGAHGNIGKPWGLAMGDRAIWTKAAGPETVLMHEIGHILDERYGLWAKIVKPAPRESYVAKRGKKAGVPVQRAVRQDAATVKARNLIKKELRALADLRYEGENVTDTFKKYVREGPEKMANLVHAFIYNPERAKEVAPNTYWAIFNVVKEHSELAPLRTLQKTRSLKLGVRTHEIPIGGFPEIGYYAMPNDAARIFNNHLSRGLAGHSAIFDAYRWLNNSMVTGQLAASGLFHVTFTGMNALFSEGGLALQEIVGGLEQHKPKLIVRGAARAATATALGTVGGVAGFALGGPAGLLWATGYPVAAMRFARGWRAKRAWLTEDPAGRVIGNDIRQLIEGGSRATWDASYDNGSFHNAIRAIRQGNYPGAIARTVPAMIDALTGPVMRWLVPCIKNAAFLNAADVELERLSEEVGQAEEAEALLKQLPQTPQARKALSDDQRAVITALEQQRIDNLSVVRDALRRVSTNMDNRFGEVVYQNWFWKTWQVNLAQVLLRSPGWQGGTYKGIVGGVADQVARIARRVGSGGDGGAGELPVADRAEGAVAPRRSKESILAADFAWLMAMVAYVTLMSGLVHYLSTGKRPHGKDWFYPMGPDGHRLAPVSYLRVIASADRHPVNTIGSVTAPLNAALWRLIVTNTTYSGEVIRQPDDPFSRQLWDALKSLGSGYQPFVLANYQRAGGGINSIMGVNRAPAEVERSDATNYLYAVLPPAPPRSHDQQEKADARQALRKAIQAKDSAAAKAAIQQGALSRGSQMAMIRRAKRDTFVNLFESATLPEAVHAYEIATPEERTQVRGLLARKWHTLLATTPPDQRAALAARLRAAANLPVTKAATQ